MSRRLMNFSIFIVVIAACIIAGYFYWLHQTLYPSTDDAYIQAYVVNIAPQISGTVQAIYVKNQAHVHNGQILIKIDPKPSIIALQKAQANLKNTLQQTQAAQSAVNTAKAALVQRQAELLNAKKNYLRVMILVRKTYYAKSVGDDATQRLTVAKAAVNAAENELAEAKNKLGETGDRNAQVQMAKAALAQAQLNLQYTQITAPAEGYIANMTTQPGQTVTAYESLFSLVETKHWWAMANMKETNLARIRAGQKALVHVDMYPSHPFHGVVDSIGPGSGSSFALLPPENATGNWVKVTQRFPVHVTIIDPNPNYPLRMGASCSVTINTR